MAQKFEDILNSCLERMLQGASIDDCLEAYPDQAIELEPLLKTCSILSQKSAEIRASSELRKRVLSHLQAVLCTKPVSARERFPLQHRRWAVALASVLVVFAAGTGIFTASEKAMPNELLYPAKLASEQIGMALTFSDLNKAKLHTQFAQRRTVEMTEMALRGEDDAVFLLSEKASAHITQMKEIIETESTRAGKGAATPAPAFSIPPGPAPAESGTVDKDNLVETLNADYTRSLHLLQVALEDAPEELKPYLERAIENLKADYGRTISIMSSYSNS